MYEKALIQDIINELTEHRKFPTENFLRSLRYIDNGLKLAEFFKLMNENGYSYRITKTFDFSNNENVNIRQFKEVYFESPIKLDTMKLLLPQYLTLDKIESRYILTMK